ncbi:MAG TPA: MOSC N-terminal beta barrel domain-containing protein [Kribbella sp.]|nr:MOSC N-terminal beta barrel domain-containing protein [Kribbella sp.]
MHLKGLWRYPVKSLAGEALAEARLTAGGVTGDRTVRDRGRRGPLTRANAAPAARHPVRHRPRRCPMGGRPPMGPGKQSTGGSTFA